MPRSAGRTAPCSRRDGDARLAQARKFLEVAELVADERDLDESLQCAAALAVLAGIAAADAACCRSLGVRFRGRDHAAAVALLSSIDGGADQQRHLRALVALKDGAHYGLDALPVSEVRRALRSAGALIGFAETAA